MITQERPRELEKVIKNIWTELAIEHSINNQNKETLLGQQSNHFLRNIYGKLFATYIQIRSLDKLSQQYQETVNDQRGAKERSRRRGIAKEKKTGEFEALNTKNEVLASLYQQYETAKHGNSKDLTQVCNSIHDIVTEHPDLDQELQHGLEAIEKAEHEQEASQTKEWEISQSVKTLQQWKDKCYVVALEAIKDVLNNNAPSIKQHLEVQVFEVPEVNEALQWRDLPITDKTLDRLASEYDALITNAIQNAEHSHTCKSFDGITEVPQKKTFKPTRSYTRLIGAVAAAALIAIAVGTHYYINKRKGQDTQINNQQMTSHFTPSPLPLRPTPNPFHVIDKPVYETKVNPDYRAANKEEAKWVEEVDIHGVKGTPTQLFVTLKKTGDIEMMELNHPKDYLDNDPDMFITLHKKSGRKIEHPVDYGVAEKTAIPLVEEGFRLKGKIDPRLDTYKVTIRYANEEFSREEFEQKGIPLKGDTKPPKIEYAIIAQQGTNIFSQSLMTLVNP